MNGPRRRGYHHGRLGLLRLVLVLVAAALAAAAVLGGLAHAARSSFGALAAQVWMLAALPLGAAIAAAVALTLRATRLESRGAAQALATLLAVLAASGVMLLRYVAEPSAVTLEPAAVLAGLRLPSSLPPIELVLFDATILALVCAFALDVAGAQLAGAYCTSCGRRSRRSVASVDRAPAPPERALSGLRRRDWRFFRQLGPPTTRSGARLRFSLYSCSCSVTRVLRVSLLRGLRRVEIVRQMQLGPDDVRTIRTLAREDAAGPRSRDWEVSTEARLARASGAS